MPASLTFAQNYLLPPGGDSGGGGPMFPEPPGVLLR